MRHLLGRLSTRRTQSGEWPGEFAEDLNIRQISLTLANKFTSHMTAFQPTSPFTVIASSRQGVLRAEVDEVAALAGLTDKEMAFVLRDRKSVV